MIKNFLIINCIGQNDIIGLKINNSFYTQKINSNNHNSESLLNSILNLLEKYKISLNSDFSALINLGPGKFSSIRTSLTILKGIKFAKGIKIYGYKNSQLPKFTLENIDFLIKSNSLENKLIKPIYKLN